MSAKRFRIAFSFAGEQRDFVAQVAAIIAKKFGEDKILYDKYHEAEFANWKLGLLLQEHYHDHSDLIVVVVCPDYSTKDWCGLEWVAIHGMLMSGKDREIMLCRFEHAKLQGLNENAGFVELEHKTPEQTATLILERLALNEGKSKEYYTSCSTNSSDYQCGCIVKNLPRLPFFYGREKELERIADALAPGKNQIWGVLICGVGGMGKTSLAICAAHTAAATFGRILFVSAKERQMTPAGPQSRLDFVLPGYLQILNEVARLLEKPNLLKSSPTRRTKAILAALEHTRALLVLDNLETLAERDQLDLFDFVERLPNGCKAIITSRRTPSDSGRIIELGKLGKAAALDYIEALAADRPLLARTDRKTRIRLYEETGGNPLLIRWVVGQLGRGRCATVINALNFLEHAPRANDPLTTLHQIKLPQLFSTASP